MVKKFATLSNGPLTNLDNILIPGNYRCYRLENADGKVWILPAGHLHTAMELYQPSGSKGKMLKKLFPYLHKLPGVTGAIHAQTISVSLADEIALHAESAFKVTELDFAVFGGTPSVHQKVTIQFFKGNKILGYGKVAASHDIAALFNHEEKLLQNLRSAGVTDIPACLYCGELQSGNHLFLQTTTKTSSSFSPENWTPLHERFLRSLTEKTCRRQLFDQTDFAFSLMSLKENVDFLPEEFRGVVLDGIDTVLQSHRGKDVDFSAFHADFTPWNMFVEQGRLFVFDWEYGRLSYPPMLDRYHFFIQQALHVKHLSPAATLDSIKSYEWFDSQELSYYLLDIISRFTLRENGQVSASLSASLKFWTDLLHENS